MISHFESTQEFQDKFGPERTGEFYDPVHLQDRKVAFSIKRKYPEDIRYKPAIYKNGEPDNIAAIWVIYAHPEESKKEIKLNKVPVRVRVANMSVYRTAHFDYDYDDPEAPTKDSLEESAATPKPIDLEYNDEYFYDHDRSVFIDSAGATLSGIEILNKVFSDHCSTVHWLKGLRLRTKLIAQSKSTGLVSALIIVLEIILKKAFGRTLEESDSISAFYRGYKSDSLKKLNEDSLNVFGYKAAKSVIIIFCIVVILGAYFRYHCSTTGGYLGFVGDSNFLSVVHGLFLLWLLDVIVPFLLFWAINGLIKVRTKIMFMQFKGP